jgi:hypothetical protein
MRWAGVGGEGRSAAPAFVISVHTDKVFPWTLFQTSHSGRITMDYMDTEAVLSNPTQDMDLCPAFFGWIPSARSFKECLD